MTLTLRELAGLGADDERPTQEELDRYAALRPGVTSSQVALATNDLLAAQRERQRAGEARRRCGTYPSTNRNPTDFGFSAGCASEIAALESASTRTAAAGASLEELRQQMDAQRRVSYDADLTPPEAVERSARIRYVRGRSGAFVPVRDPSTFQPPPAPARRRSAWPLVLGVAALGGAAVFFARR